MLRKSGNSVAGRSAFKDCLLKPSTLLRGLVICLIVGTVLTLVNQWDYLAQGLLPDPWRTLVTYLVPFIVSTFSTASAYAAFQHQKKTTRQPAALEFRV